MKPYFQSVNELVAFNSHNAAKKSEFRISNAIQFHVTMIDSPLHEFCLSNDGTSTVIATAISIRVQQPTTLCNKIFYVIHLKRSAKAFIWNNEGHCVLSRRPSRGWHGKKHILPLAPVLEHD